MNGIDMKFIYIFGWKTCREEKSKT